MANIVGLLAVALNTRIRIATYAGSSMDGSGVAKNGCVERSSGTSEEAIC